jgi:phage terminase large subunit
VFSEFDPAVHVGPVRYDPALPLYRAIDFGFTNPFVCLWIQAEPGGRVRVIDEYIRDRRRTCEHGRAIIAKTPCDEARVAGTFCDPAGVNHQSSSGSSDVKELKSLGIHVQHRCSAILDGIEYIRAHLRAGDGSHRLLIDPRCQKLITAMQCYHYPPKSAAGFSELPQKDGLYDHPIDALRYFFVNALAGRCKITSRY